MGRTCGDCKRSSYWALKRMSCLFRPIEHNSISKQADRSLGPREITDLNPNVECWDPPLAHDSAPGFTFKSKSPACFSMFRSFCGVSLHSPLTLDPLVLMLSLIFQPSKVTTSGIKGTTMSAGYLSCLLLTRLTYKYGPHNFSRKVHLLLFQPLGVCITSV